MEANNLLLVQVYVPAVPGGMGVYYAPVDNEAAPTIKYNLQHKEHFSMNHQHLICNKVNTKFVEFFSHRFSFTIRSVLLCGQEKIRTNRRSSFTNAQEIQPQPTSLWITYKICASHTFFLQNLYIIFHTLTGVFTILSSNRS